MYPLQNITENITKITQKHAHANAFLYIVAEDTETLDFKKGKEGRGGSGRS